MAALRALGIVIALACFFLIGAPLQWLVARRLPRAAAFIPLLFCRSLLGLLGVRWSIEGARVRQGPVLMVANHVSWIDILALGAIAPFCFLAKKEVAGWPVLSAFADVQGTLYVDRQRRRGIPSINRQMADRMAADRAVLLFPEGTTFRQGEPGLFRSSHFAAARDALQQAGGDPVQQVRVQPIAISYSSAEASWIGDDDLLSHLWRTLRAPPLACTVMFLEPIAYTAGADRKVIAQASRAAILDALARRQPAAEPQACTPSAPPLLQGARP